MKKVIITGVTGQDGSLMADYLLKNTDNIVIAGVRRLSVENHKNIEHLKENPRFELVDLDITDQVNIENVIKEHKPDYFINFAANSFVGNSWTMPVNHMNTNAMSVMYQLEAIRKHCPTCRYYNAGSSEEFGDVVTIPQSETHPLRPRSPYGVSKTSARHMVKVWRESYGLYAIQGWLFNHEGVRRGIEFVTRKITHNVARITKEVRDGEKIKPLELGNIDAKRDWSDAEDFVEGIWMMMNQEKHNPELSKDLKDHKKMISQPVSERTEVEFLSKKIKEYVLSSNETHTIREFIEQAFSIAGFGIEECRWEGQGIQERYYHGDQILVSINPKYYRPAEVDILFGDSTKARAELGWLPKTDFINLIRKMIEADMKEIS